MCPGGEASAKPTKKHSKARQPWTIDDDNVLVSAYLNTSKDSIIGDDQTADSFWKKIATYYNSYKKTVGTRDEKGCKNRWHTINGQVGKFVGCYKHATDRKKSGESESDVILEAHKIYESDSGKKFNLEHAWLMLRDDPKWMMVGDDSSSKRTRLNVQGNYSSSSSTGTPSMPTTPCTPCTPSSDPAYASDVPFMSPEPVLLRPIGVKAAKRKAKEKVNVLPSVDEVPKAGDAATSQRLGVLTEMAASQKLMAEAIQTNARTKQYLLYEKLATNANRTRHEDRLLARLDAELFPNTI